MTVMAKTDTTKPPKKAKGTSKKTKKGWRKNVDVTEVEDFLEDKRLEERLGGGAFAEKADDELFVIDADAKDEAEEQPVVSSRKARRLARASKPLKCYQHLEITSGVADPIKARNRRKTPEERKNPTVVQKEKDLIAKGIVKAKTKLQKKHRELEKIKKASQVLERTTRRRTKFDFDIWDDDNDKTTEAITEVKANDWLEGNTKIHTLNNTGKLRRAKPVDYHEKPSDLNAVELPHSGTSYNPSYKDHQDLLWKAAIVEMNKEKADRKIEYHTTRMYPDAKNAPTHETWLKEMSEGLPGLDKDEAEIVEPDEDVDVSDEDDEESEAKMFKPKTKVQRNKEKKLRRLANQRRMAKEDKKLTTDMFRIKSMKREIVLDEKTTEAKMALRKAMKKAKRSLPAVLSGTKFEEPEVDLKLSNELTGNLRSMKPEGNILDDRFKAFQKRNIIETRTKRKISKPKHKRKKAEKRSYKMGFSWEK